MEHCGPAPLPPKLPREPTWAMEADVLRRLNVNVLGKGDPTVVLGHGFGSDQTGWRHQVEALAPRARVVLFDHVGCGKSDVSAYSPLRYDRLERYADDVIALHDSLGLRDVTFVGHSMSGMIGVAASLARPDLFRQLVLVGASPRYLNEPGYVGGFERADLDALYAAMASDYLGWANGFGPVAMANRDRPGLGEEFARTLAAMQPDIAQSVARVIFESDLRALLPSVSVPVLVLQSRNDIAVPVQVGEYLARHIPRARMLLLNAEGHFPHLSAPSEVSAAIRELLGDAA